MIRALRKVMNKISEADWKVFKAIKIKAIEGFCNKALSDFEEVIRDKTRGSHETYAHLYGLVQNRDKLMALIFDGQSRSKASFQLLAMRGEGLVSKELLEQLSEEFLEQSDPTLLS